MRTIFRSLLVTILVLAFTAGTRAIVFTNLYSFSPGTFNTPTAGGYNPQNGLLLFGNALYGTTASGGSNNVGTVFVYSLTTGFANLCTFNGGNGATPLADLVGSGKTLFGTTAGGGAYGGGTIFAVNTNSTGFSNLFNFAFTNGAAPQAGLALSGNTLYGTTSKGGAYGGGTLFAINTDGTGFTNLYNFDYTNGATPQADLLLFNGMLYGTTAFGGNGWGTIFAINTNGTGFTNLFSFSLTNGASPRAGLALVSNVLCGTTFEGGVDQDGTVFSIATNGAGFNVLFDFGNSLDGTFPYSQLAVSSNGASSYSLYGTTSSGGSANDGAAFVLNVSGPALSFSSFTVLSSFSTVQQPMAGLLLSPTLSVLYGVAVGNPPLGSGSLFSLGDGGGTPTVLHSFPASAGYATTNGDGGLSRAGLVAAGNTLYGTASAGGANGHGTVFAVNTDGTAFTNLCSLSGPDAGPWAALTLSGNALFGTASGEVALGDGLSFEFGTDPEIFAINTDGSDFTNIVGLGTFENPQGTLVLADGTLYGTLPFGGAGSGEGALFSVSTNGTGLTNFYSFSFATGLGPQAGLTLGGSSFYGTTPSGGKSDQGVLFAVNTNGIDYTDFLDFNGTNGDDPYASLVLSGNRLYGTTRFDSDHGYGTVFAVNTDGSDFTNLYIFNGYDGAQPLGGLVLSGDTLYGSTWTGGAGGFGTVFAINTDGTGFTTLYNFSGGWDGAAPYDGLLLSGNTLYGTTSSGGSGENGTVFALSLGPIPLYEEPDGDNVVLRWGNPAFLLQSAPVVNGTYTTVSGAASPWTNTVAGSAQFFRLQVP